MSFSSPRHWPIKQKTSDSFHPFAQISYAKPKEPQIYETKKFDTNFVEKKSTVQHIIVIFHTSTKKMS